MRMNMHDEWFMGIAIKEAKKGLGRTSPNPCVGAVIVKNGEIVAKGYHKRAGTAHAEIHAMRKGGESVRGATLYVTLEPCSHAGRTPPCCNAIVNAGLSRVVVGMTDPNPLVHGSGLEYLRNHGLDVVSGVLMRECEAINLPFIKYITQKTPWVIMKAGLSLDGRLNYQKGESGWITGEQSLRDVHRLRDRVDAILVGRGTIEIDNPSLTARISGKRTKDPARVVVDSSLSTSTDAKVYNLASDAPTLLFCGHDVRGDKVAQFRKKNVKVFQIGRSDSGLDLNQLLEILGGEKICSLLVEGGACLHGALLKAKLFDYAHLYYAPLFAGNEGLALVEGWGVKGQSAAPRLRDVHRKRLGDDIVISGKFHYPD